MASSLVRGGRIQRSATHKKGVFAYPPETSTPFRGDMQKPPRCRRGRAFSLLNVSFHLVGRPLGQLSEPCLGAICGWGPAKTLAVFHLGFCVSTPI